MHEDIIEAMRERLQRYPEKMRRRKELVEHPFAIIKRWMNHDYFLMRGKMKVAAEVSMSVPVYNMKRVLNIVSVSGLIAALQAIQERTLSFPLNMVRQKSYSTNYLLTNLSTCLVM